VNESTIVCILGMHRSGTSLVTRLLNELGLYLGPEDHLMRPGPANPAGHWESRAIKDINDEILFILGGTWYEPPELTPGWERSSELAGPRRQARKLIEADFSGSDLWGFKDPRTSLTAPFWQRIVGPMRYVICLRNPVDVAASLEAREDEPVPFAEGAELWLTYVRAGLAASAGHPREFVFYEDLVADPEPLAGRLARFIGTHASDTAEEDVQVAIRVAHHEGLWHHRTSVPNVVDASRLAFHVKALYLGLRQFVAGVEEVGAEVLDLLGNYAADAGRELVEAGAALEELDELRDQWRRLDSERARLQQRLSERNAELERATKSHAEEQLLRRDLEAELEATRTELEQLQKADRDSGADGPELLPNSRSSEYERDVGELRARAVEMIPSGSTVLVASKGDDALVQFDGRRAWHFPRAGDGRYVGYHPSGDTAAIAHLEALRAQGADHLLIPAAMSWWLDHYHGLRRHLEERYVLLLRDELCAIYALRDEDGERATGPIAALKRVVAGLRIRSGRDPSILDWRTGLAIADHLPGVPVFFPPDEEAVLPYLDGTIDTVVVSSTDASRIPEARRVAASAVVSVDPSFPDAAAIEWLAGGSGGWGEDVSVTLIPNGDESAWNATLSAFAETLDEGFAGELTVVGDPRAIQAAGDRVAAAGLQFHPIETPSGASVIERARMATEAAGRRIHVFVTAPALPLPDWLPSMLALFSTGRAAGVVGARVLTPDGALKEAGGILAPDGSLRRRGEGDADPDRPAYRFVNRVDFCSPPLLATRIELFERLAGREDAQTASADGLIDFSLRAARSGAPVYYQPQARVVTIGDEGR
jgi:hypothetical protein